MTDPEQHTIVLASNNAGKVREFNQLLHHAKINVVPQSQFDVIAAEETGLSFVENALLKARATSAQTGLPALADDSGLEVNALHGAPGIYSARYAGENASDEQNSQHLLKQMQYIADGQRNARFYCALVYLRHADDPTPVICQGSWPGRILRQPQGDNGFGYDPIFYVLTHNCSAAQLDANEKNRLSHRGQALRQIQAYFQT